MRPSQIGIAPCGIDCRYCRAHLRAHNPCPGCADDSQPKPTTRTECVIKNCAERGAGQLCSSCTRFPCAQLRRLDLRYRHSFDYSPIANLERIRRDGLTRVLDEEARRWTCSHCGSACSLHTRSCVACDAPVS